MAKKSRVHMAQGEDRPAGVFASKQGAWVFRQPELLGWQIERMKSNEFLSIIQIFSTPCINTLPCETNLIAERAIAMIDGSLDRQSTRKLYGLPHSLPRICIIPSSLYDPDRRRMHGATRVLSSISYASQIRIYHVWYPLVRSIFIGQNCWPHKLV